MSPADGSRSTRTKSTHSTCPTTATRMPQSHIWARSSVSTDDESRAHPAVRVPLSGAPRRALRLPRPAARARACGGRVPGDVPARAPRLSQAPARAPSAGVAVHDRRAGGRGRAPPASAHHPARARSRPGHATGICRARAPRGRASGHRTRRGRLALRLRPVLRRHRRGARIERAGSPPGRLRRSPAPAQKEDRNPMTVSPQLDARFRDAAAAEGLLDVAYDVTDSPIGPLLVAASERGLCRISFDPDPERELESLSRSFGARVLRSPKPVDPVKRQLDEYFEGNRTSFDLETDVERLTSFNRRVLEALARVPYGTLTTYGTLAGEAGRPRAARTVGMVMNRNPIPIVLPCHRVVGSTGSLVGYAGGLERKETLLRLEGALV